MNLPVSTLPYRSGPVVISRGFEGETAFGEEGFVVFYVFEEFDGEDTIVGLDGEFVGNDVGCYGGYVGEREGRGEGRNVVGLGVRVGEGGYVGGGELLGEIEG